MHVLFRKALIAVLLLLLLGSVSNGQKPAATIPGFRFLKLDNTAFTNKDLDRDRLLFFCFFDVSCDHCQRALTQINQRHAEFKGASLYLVSLEKPDGIKNFLSHYGPGLAAKKNVTLLVDAENQFISRFKPVKYPAMFLYSKSGKLMLYDDREDKVGKFLERIKASAR
jgi:peroxiredoxin